MLLRLTDVLLPHVRRMHMKRAAPLKASIYRMLEIEELSFQEKECYIDIVIQR